MSKKQLRNLILVLLTFGWFICLYLSFNLNPSIPPWFNQPAPLPLLFKTVIYTLLIAPVFILGYITYKLWYIFTAPFAYFITQLIRRPESTTVGFLFWWSILAIAFVAGLGLRWVISISHHKDSRG